jgi:amidohydrolase
MTHAQRFCLGLFALLLCLGSEAASAQPNPWSDAITEKAADLESQVIDWRRDIHRNPELSNRETRTAEKVAGHLRELDMEVETGVSKTGVVGVLEGGKPGPVIALRADMDALPVKERVDVPFASTDSAMYNGEKVPVMHACGHDTHVAMLMGAAEILASMREELPGTVKFLFQPAEEGAPKGERGGADVMVEEGALADPDVDVVFGLHINSQTEVGTIRYRPGPIMAASDVFRIDVTGKQTHGSSPWDGVDPIVTASQIVNNLQTIVSRQSELTKEPAVVSVGKIEGGVRNNIIPETTELVGTVRTLDTTMQRDIHNRIRRVATSTAEGMGASVDVEIDRGYPVTKNDPALTETMKPTLERVADSLVKTDPITGAEDFSYFAREVPGLYVFVGGMPPDMDPENAPPHHTPSFFIDESGMQYGVQAYAQVAADYLSAHAE